MLLNQKERESVELSILHWKKDIQEKFERGYIVKARPNNLRVWETVKGKFHDYLYAYSESCALCHSYYDVDECQKCPYAQYYNRPCYVGDAHWNTFIGNPTHKTCNAMIDALQSILDSDVESRKELHGHFKNKDEKGETHKRS